MIGGLGRRNPAVDAAARAAMDRAAAQRPTPRIPEQQELSIEVHPEQQVVEFKTRDRLAIHPTSIFVPFAFLELTFYAVLGLRVAPLANQLSAGRSPDLSADVSPRSATGTPP